MAYQTDKRKMGNSQREMGELFADVRTLKDGFGRVERQLQEVVKTQTETTGALSSNTETVNKLIEYMEGDDGIKRRLGALEYWQNAKITAEKKVSRMRWDIILIGLSSAVSLGISVYLASLK